METSKSRTNPSLQAVPEPTVRRMALYLNLIKQCQRSGVEYVTAPLIGRMLKQDPTQVVKDLSYTQVTGKPKVGYQVEEMILAIEEFLGYHRAHEAFLVGAGALGTALIRYPGFRELGVNIVAAFDTDKQKVGTEIAGIPVFDMEKFRNLAERIHIPIGIITTPAEAAQSVADLMVVWGIRAIWNFAPVAIRVPETIIVQHTHFYSNLAFIVNKLKQSGNEQETA